MKKVNFEIKSMSDIKVAGRLLDIHNNFELMKLEYSIHDDRLNLGWSKSKGDWVPVDELDGFDLVFEGIQLFKVEGRFEKARTKNLEFSHCGYLHPNDTEVMDGCLDEHESGKNYHMIFVFNDNFSIKLYANIVTFVERKINQ